MIINKRRGEGQIAPAILIVCVCMLLSVFVSFVSYYGIVKQVKRNIRLTLDNYVMENSIEIYDSIKNGNDENPEIDNKKYIQKFVEFCTFVKSGSFIYNYDSDRKVEYFVSIPVIQYAKGNSLKLYVSLDVYIPVYFAGNRVATITVPLKVTSYLNEKFL